MRRRLLALVVLALLAARDARASAADVFGLGSEESALAGAVAARVSGFASAFYNPAGLAGTRATEASFGLLGAGASLSVNGRDQPQPITSAPPGVLLGAATPVPLGSFLRDRLFVGIALYIDPEGLARVIAHTSEQPFFPYYDDRTQRLMVMPALAVRIGWGLSAGLALDYLAGLDGQVQASEGFSRAVEPRVDESIFATAHVNAGLRWRSPSERVALALVYRQRFSVPFTTVTRNRVAGEPLDIAIDAEGLYSPDQLVAGTAFRPLPWLRLSIDLTASFWSSWRGPFVTVDSDLPIVGSLSAPPPTLAYRDTLSSRVGLEVERALASWASLRLRGDYGFETSPIPADQATTNLLDGPKHLLAAGAGVRVTRGPIALRLDAHAQLQVMPEVSLVKGPGVPDSNPGFPSITGGGLVWSAGFLITVER